MGWAERRKIKLLGVKGGADDLGYQSALIFVGQTPESFTGRRNSRT